MNWYWLAIIALAAWFAVGLCVALLIGPVLARNSQEPQQPAQKNDWDPCGSGPLKVLGSDEKRSARWPSSLPRWSAPWPAASCCTGRSAAT